MQTQINCLKAIKLPTSCRSGVGGGKKSEKETRRDGGQKNGVKKGESLLDRYWCQS